MMDTAGKGISPLKNKIRDLFFESFNVPEIVKLFLLASTIFAAVFLIVSSREIKKMNTKYSFSEFFPKTHALLTQSQKVRQHFQLEEHSDFLLVLRSERSSWVQAKELRVLRTLTERVRHLQGVNGATSLATLEGATESQGQILVGPVLAGLTPAERKNYVAENPLVRGQLISEDLKSTLIVIEPQKLSPKELTQLREKLLKEAALIAPAYPAELAGSPEIQAQFTNKLNQELKFLLAMSLIVFCLIFVFFIRGWRGRC
jgi:predicted RND superfamily exporter protein